MYNKEIRLCLDKDNGYLYFCDAKHPLAGSNGIVRYHRHVASLKIGRWLSPSEAVHHIDGNTLNNNPPNLEIMTNSEHARRHKPLSVSEVSICPRCGKTFVSVFSGVKFCSQVCNHRNLERFDISKEELEVLTWQIPTSEIAKRFGVSDNAIAKRCKKFGISKPPRGYWTKFNKRI